MEMNDNLFNAAMIGENSESSFILEGKRLHAVEKRIAQQKLDLSNPKLLLPYIRNALKALVQYASGKVESHFLEIDWKLIEGKQDEYDKLIHLLRNIYIHLPHHDHNELSTLIHHKQISGRKR